MTHPTTLMLQTVPLFHSLPEEALLDLTAEMQIANRRRGEALEDLRNTAWFVHRGAAAVYTVTSRGGRKILFFQGPGALLNQDVMSGDGQLLAEAAADSILLRMDREALAERVRTTPALTEALFAHYEDILWRLSHQLKNTAGSGFVERKLAAKLLKLSTDFGRPAEGGIEISFPLSIQQLADYAGVPRETASRACRQLANQGLVHWNRKRFLIPSRTALEAFRRGV